MTPFENEEKTIEELKSEFSRHIVDAKVQRARRIWIEVQREKAAEIIAHMAGKMGYTHLSTITGMDFGNETLGAIYHIANPSTVINLVVKTPLSKPELDSVTPTFPVAENFERELKDMFGIEIRGLPEGRRYPLPEDWPEEGQYPLRKSWKQEDFFKSEAGSCLYGKYLKDGEGTREEK